ncbi:prealbumin-like fold domain-containing protein [Clostridium sp. DSM 100503]|uniref:prealbumin-like fold domain-containing protein n=1 Tax=Clostridium sp. DSM 100503 TaxID=2963282 RepID=UPI002149CC40|nr:prealbumin-like fold domain-containing protein [Clostridium sp. DSM 100503]MCR1953155.1 prealbumin-like fold domain-containing protein [Clostridium sp. DSM 100503]
MLESIKSDFIRFGGMELMGKIIIGLSIFILGIKIIKDIYNMEISSNYKARKKDIIKDIINRIISYIIYFIHTIIVVLGIFNIKLLNINLVWLSIILVIYIGLRIWSKLYARDKKDIVEIYKDRKLVDSVKVKDGKVEISNLPCGKYIIKEYL